MKRIKRLTVSLIVFGMVTGFGQVVNHGSYIVNAARPVSETTSPGQLKLQLYNMNTSATTNTMNLNIRVINSGTTPLALENVNILYYYVINSKEDQNFCCDYATIGSANVIGVFTKMDTPKVGADYYLKIGFSEEAGSLAPGTNIIIQARVTKSKWGTYTQVDDYSFNPTAVSYMDWTKITGLTSGVLSWGVEP